MTEELKNIRTVLDEELLKQRGKYGLMKPINDCFFWRRKGTSLGLRS